jgi:hypothetical protein
MLKIGNVRAKVGYEILQGFKRLKKRYGDVTMPLLILHGAAGQAESGLRLIASMSSAVSMLNSRRFLGFSP